MSHKRHKHNTKRKRIQKQPSSKRMLPFLLVVSFLGLGIVGYIVSGVMVRNHTISTMIANVKARYIAKKPPSVTVVKNTKQATLPAEEPIKFEFYSTLENGNELVALDQADETAKLTTKDKKKL